VKQALSSGLEATLFFFVLQRGFRLPFSTSSARAQTGLFWYPWESTQTRMQQRASINVDSPRWFILLFWNTDGLVLRGKAK
jgi:hypothetical protein